MHHKLICAFLALCALQFPAPSFAARPDINLSTPAMGTDMWTLAMGRRGDFVIHEDDCDSGTEAFVELLDDEGYCIEKSERSAALWEEARQTCFAAGKRLPEPGEWKYACGLAGGLSISNMTDDWEWASNFPIPIMDNSNGYVGQGLDALVMGDGACNKGIVVEVATYGTGSASMPYRCVR